MPLKNYSLLKGNVADSRAERDDDTPHFQVLIEAAGISYRIAVNVMSSTSPHELKYLVLADLKHPVIQKLESMPDGLHRVVSKPRGVALDYLRGNLFDFSQMKIIPHDLSGPDNDLNDLFTMYTQRAKRKGNARAYAFGETWGPEPNKPDAYFGFKPGRGIHDIHMNQGNGGRWKRDNGVFQDGGVLFHYPEDGQWIGVFLAFQSQSVPTDERGHPVENANHDLESAGSVQIVAALVNPHGDDPGLESVTLINKSDKPVNLGGWSIEDKNGGKEFIATQLLHTGECLRVLLSGDGVRLGNQGGTIDLKTPQGVKVHGVAYTSERAARSGWTLVF